MKKNLTLAEARAAKCGFTVEDRPDYYRIIPANSGTILDDGATYLPRAVALVPRHGNDDDEFHLAVNIASMLSEAQ